MTNQAQELIIENEKLKLKIANLQSKDRIIAIAQEAGMKQNIENVFSVQKENAE